MNRLGGMAQSRVTPSAPTMAGDGWIPPALLCHNSIQPTICYDLSAPLESGVSAPPKIYFPVTAVCSRMAAATLIAGSLP